MSGTEEGREGVDHGETALFGRNVVGLGKWLAENGMDQGERLRRKISEEVEFFLLRDWFQGEK